MLKPSNLHKNLTFFLLLYFQINLYLNFEGAIWTIPSSLNKLFFALFLINTMVSVFRYRWGHRNLLIYFVVISLFAMMLGLFNSVGVHENSNPYNDLVVCFLMVNSFILQEYDEKDIINFIKISIILSCIITIYELIIFDVSSIAVLISSRNLWDIALFYCGVFFWCVPFLVLYSVVYNKLYAYAIIPFILALIINLISTKRGFVMEMIWLGVILLYFLKKLGKIRIVGQVLLVILASIIAIVGIIRFTQLDLNSLFEALKQRFDKEIVEDNGFVRFRESEIYFDSANLFDIVFGRGIGVQHHGLGKDDLGTALHIGVTNLIFKFGFFIVIVYLILLIRALRNVRYIPWLYVNNKWKLVALLVVLVQTPSFLFLANFWAVTPSTCFFWYFLLIASKPIYFDNYPSRQIV